MAEKDSRAPLRVPAAQASSPLSFPESAAPAVRRPLAASLTVEAALTLPLFLFFLALLMLPMRIMDTGRQMQTVCESVCRSAAKYAYTVSSLSEKLLPADDPEAGSSDEAAAFRSRLTGQALGAYAAAAARDAVADENVSGLLWYRSSVLDENEMITVTLDYCYELPFSVFGVPPLKQTVTASCRAWVGADDPGGDAENRAARAEPEDPVVYVGKDSTRYHLRADCHYLSNDLEAVPFSAVAGLRNRNSERYHACPVCASAVAGGTVYIMPYGYAYHAAADCRAIRSYVRAVRLSEVSHLGPCSYCGKEHDS